MLDVAIVGGGIFGQVVAAHLHQSGRSVVLIDDARPGAGSPPAGCVVRPSWLMGKMSKVEIERCLGLLDGLYGLREVKFKLSPAPGSVTCHRVETNMILAGKTHYGKVEKIGSNFVTWDVGDPSLVASTDARHVVVATGIWAQELCPWAPKVQPRWGWSFRGPPVAEPRIHLWAPYRQVVSFNMDDGRSWMGDGSALVKPTEVHRAKAEQRCRAHTALDMPGVPTFDVNSGARPVIPGLARPAYLEQGPDGVWCLTGGGKNGLAAAAWAAMELERRLR